MGWRCMRRDAASRGRRKQAAPPALVWFWRLEEDITEETRQTVKVAGVLNNLNWNQQGHLTTIAESSMSTYTGSTIQSTPRTVLLFLQLTKGEATKAQDKAQAPPRASTTFWKRLHLVMWSINRIFALEPWKSMNIIFCPILQDGQVGIIWDHPWISIFSPPRGIE